MLKTIGQKLRKGSKDMVPLYKEDPGKAFEKGRIGAGYVGLDTRRCSRIGRLLGHKGRNKCLV